MNIRAFYLLLLLLIGPRVWSATVTNIVVPSPAMKKDIPVTVILPEAYRSDNARLPVLYLLHGYSDNNQTWSKRTSIKDLADQYGIIVICSDGGYSSWYFDSPVNPAWRYETFVARELVAYVDGHYRTLPKRESRAIAGQSMGGHGAMYLAIRHPDEFSVVVCLSGGVDLRPFSNKWDIAKRLGSLQGYPDRWSANSVTGERARNGETIWKRMVYAGDTPIRRQVKIKGDANPFDPEWRTYFAERAFHQRFGITCKEAGIKSCV